MDKIVDILAKISPVDLTTLGPAEVVNLALAVALVCASLALLARPFANLGLTVFHLATVNPAILGSTLSAGSALLLVVNCLVGIALGRRVCLAGGRLLALSLLGIGAALGAGYGLLLGNSPVLVLGDLYQMMEIGLVFFVASMLVKTAQQFRAISVILVASIAFASALRAFDVVVGANYLWALHVPVEEAAPIRIINMNAPIAFALLLAVLPFARWKWPIAVLAALVEVSLILSFTRGLWGATVAAVLFLLIVLRGARLAVLKFAVLAALFAIVFLYATGLAGITIERLAFVAVQWKSVPQQEQLAQVAASDAESPKSVTPDEKIPRDPATELSPFSERSPMALPVNEQSKSAVNEQTISGRRRLEHILTFPDIRAHPFLGRGLGATYKISGNAILQGPKGEIVDAHFLHDLYLQIAFRLGIPALLIFLAMLGAYFVQASRALWRSNLAPIDRGLMAGLVAAVFGEAALSLTSPTFFIHPTAGLIGCVMALTSSMLHVRSRQPAALEVLAASPRVGRA